MEVRLELTLFDPNLSAFLCLNGKIRMNEKQQGL